MEFVVRTKYTYERLLKFNNFFAASKKGFWAFMFCCDILILLISVLVFTVLGFDETIFICLLFSIVITATYLICYFLLPRFTFKKFKHLNALLKLTFTEDDFEDYTEASTVSGTTRMKYGIIAKVMEDDENIYLFISKNQAYIIDKNGFEKGNANEFKAFLRSKVEPRKFKC